MTSPEPNEIYVKGAREHNLDIPELSIPKRKLVVITGVSGSGKSSLAFDTLYAEGQRRYVESLSAYARQFLGQMEKPKYDQIRGLSPTIAIQQKASSSNPRSTVGTVTEIYDYLRVFYARVGKQHCHQCGKKVGASSSGEIVRDLKRLPEGTKLTLLAPKVENRKGEFKDLLSDARLAGYVRGRIDGILVRLEDVDGLEKKKKHTIDIVVDRIAIKKSNTSRLTDSVEAALREGGGKLIADIAGSPSRTYSEQNMCTDCGLSFPELSPQSFSFNSPLGMCVSCNGLGERKQVDPTALVPDKTLTLREGAIASWGNSLNRESWTANIVDSVSKSHKISLDKPWNKLTKKQQQVLLYGTGQKRVAVKWQGKHSEGSWGVKFEGAVGQLERRYRETNSERARQHYERFFRSIACVECSGTRLRPESTAVLIAKRSLDTITEMTVTEAKQFFEKVKLKGADAKIAEEVLKEIRSRLSFLQAVGLTYLTLNRTASTLSGGEAQRIRLASQLGSELSGVLYVLDEPSIGLHQRDNERLIETLQRLRDLGNTVLVVEHDEATILASDHVIDMGPGAGKHGGKVIAQGTPKQLKRHKQSVTGKFLSGKETIADFNHARRTPHGFIELTGATENNLKNVSAKIPLGCMVAVTGVSGAGKSSLINHTLHPALMRHLHSSQSRVGEYQTLTGIEQVDKVIVIDQRPIGRTPRSNPATYTKAFDLIRAIFSKTPEARTYGYAPGRFSFNVSAEKGGGRCEACEGAGVKEVEMHFLPNVFVTCEICNGKRYNDATLRVTFKGLSIADVLATPIEEALTVFKNQPKLAKILQTLVDVGLGYIAVGQSATTLSGGEAQRIKLARELAKRQTGKTLYLLDEPTTGLHFKDVKRLLEVLNRLVESGNTVLVIEHNLDVVASSDWVIDLGPEGGDKGGKIVAAGTPEKVATNKKSYTGQFLADML